MDGSEKLPLLVIGNKKKPVSFNHLLSLPVDYTSASKSWIDWEVFRSWILKLDAKFQENERNVLMFAQDYGHLKRLLQYELKAINLQFLSTNKQPLDYGVTTELKKCYRHDLVKWCRENFGLTNTMTPKTVSTLQSIRMLARCWTVGVSPGIIRSSFKKAGFFINDADLDLLGLSEDVMQEEEMEPWFEKYCAVDQNVACKGFLTDEDILQIVNGEDDVEPSGAENCSGDGESRELTIQTDLQSAMEHLSRSLQLITNVPPCMFEHLSIIEDIFQRRGKLKVTRVTEMDL
ncbi:tigger transposable element-derived protein 4-like isoform X2 [Anopheles bellator]|nr:tigger transposable element-derived protein 4-like isoform X2 [Anopheles bellator]XP_058066600.1 tigger transposable element-derived protein 4-like isoform X2 [Anopheles bellator]XP_058066602.1 tigger transposable element-derived protein 4-like isoform X2 [Anopheles bellator]